jgi:hypothetical protein
MYGIIRAGADGIDVMDICTWEKKRGNTGFPLYGISAEELSVRGSM